MAKKETKSEAKVHKVMHEFKHGELHSGSKHGPVVKSRDQAIAIAMHESGQSNEPKHARKMVRHSPLMEEVDMQKIYTSEEI